ncbi:SWIM zinc finger protein [Actinocorallia herbida]|uniref:SWIM zinc finger protein n=1 Tax=Actinocorallia herbida TaxID=58109 RepID=A0A3N1D5Y9_9ACTN|nr:SWIM zinc finger family protein [Actinocorallia herbida]ROO88944.1 SWIM zinc finger protein [Actinocorallia herbida]
MDERRERTAGPEDGGPAVRWGRERVLALAPDAASRKAADALAGRSEGASGSDGALVWAEGRYATAVELAGPAFRCSCPSRKIPCKHALGLLLRWSDGAVPETGAQARPAWAEEWVAARRERAAARVIAAEEAAAEPNAPGAASESATARRRAERVDDGVAEFGRWLRDQVSRGLAGAERAPYSLWDEAARRLVDAQAGTLAGRVKELAALPRGGEHWPERLLEEYGLLHLLVRAHTKGTALAGDLRETVRTRIGFPTPREEVLAGPHLRDAWQVLGSRETAADALTTRRTWLRGRRTGRPALLLAFAPTGRSLEPALPPGTQVEASLAFHPAAQPLRALVVEQHSAPEPSPPEGGTVMALLEEYAAALTRDPWLDRWPACLADVRLAHSDPLQVVDPAGHALPLLTADPWHLLALSGGAPFTLTAEWTPTGLRPLTAHHPEEGLLTLP